MGSENDIKHKLKLSPPLLGFAGNWRGIGQIEVDQLCWAESVLYFLQRWHQGFEIPSLSAHVEQWGLMGGIGVFDGPGL